MPRRLEVDIRVNCYQNFAEIFAMMQLYWWGWLTVKQSEGMFRHLDHYDTDHFDSH